MESEGYHTSSASIPGIFWKFQRQGVDSSRHGHIQMDEHRQLAVDLDRLLLCCRYCCIHAYVLDQGVGSGHPDHLRSQGPTTTR